MLLFFNSSLLLSMLIIIYIKFNQFYQQEQINYSKKLDKVHQIVDEKINLNSPFFKPCKNNEKSCILRRKIILNYNYCRESDLYKLLHPDTILEDAYIYRDLGIKDYVRRKLLQKYFDVGPLKPNLTPPIQLPNVQIFELILFQQTSLLYTLSPYFHKSHLLGQAGICLFQKYFHIPGEIASKSNQMTLHKIYLQKLQLENKSESCIDDAKIFLKTYRLFEVEECTIFFSEISKANMAQEIKYIIKTNQHRGEGVYIMDQQLEDQLKEWYKNGINCGLNLSKTIVQEYLQRPMLYQGYKMEFRVYFLVASTSPAILYVYNRTLMKHCALKFNLSDPQKERHVCNTAIVKDNINEDEIEPYIDWNLEELQSLLIQEGKINQTDWLDKFLYPQIYRKVTHFFLTVRSSLFRDSRFGEAFALDFVLDQDLRLWIFECNRNFNFLDVSEGRSQLFENIIKDMIEVENSILRSRFRRIKKIIDENQQISEQIIKIVNRDQVATNLSNGNQNHLVFLDKFKDSISYLEKGCQIENKWQKIQ